MEFKFLKLRDLQGKTPSFPAAGEVHIIYVLTKVWYACMNPGMANPILPLQQSDGIFILIFLIPKATLHLQCQPLHH